MTGLFAGDVCAVDFDPLVVQEISIFGCLGAPGLWPECISLHKRGLVRAERIITHRLPLSEFAEAIEIARGRKEGSIKVLLTP
jgi:L-iditol 2-dehydrogenase